MLGGCRTRNAACVSVSVTPDALDHHPGFIEEFAERFHLVLAVEEFVKN